MHAISSSRRGRGIGLLGLAATFALALSVLTPPAVAMAATDKLYIYWMGDTVQAGELKSFSVYASADTVNPDYCFQDTVHFTSSDPLATLPGDYKYNSWGFLCAPSADAGWHDFTATLRTAGQQTLTVQDLDNSAIVAGSISINVAAGTAVTLTMSDLPVSATAGAGASFKVTARDAWGNIATGFTGTVATYSSDTGATLPGPYVFTAGDAGAHEFAVTFETAGSQSVTVLDPASPSTLHASASTTVKTAAHFNVDCQDQIAGAQTQCSVTAVNANGTIDTAYTGTLKFSSSDSGADLPVDALVPIGEKGQPPDFNPTFYKAGAQTFAVRDSVNSDIKGETTLTVYGGETVGLSISNLPSTVAAGIVQVTVNTHDAYGNWGEDGSVHLTSSDLRAVMPGDFSFHLSAYGTHTFDVSLETPGTTTITATCPLTSCNPVIVASRSTLVDPGAVDHFAVSSATSWTAGVASTFHVAAVDVYGNTVPRYHGTVHFTSTDPKAILPADYAFIQADGGSHYFSITLDTAGSQAIRARDTITTNLTGLRKGIAVQAASAAILTVAGFPSTDTAGSAHPVTVKAFDVYGNVATGYRGTVHFTSTDVAAALPINYAFTAADAGVHAFSVTFETAGTQSVRARDTVTSTITGLQKGIVVGPAAAALLSVSGFPSPDTAGVAHTITVKAVDAYGNATTTYVGTVHFTSTDGAALLPANYTFTSADKGVHTFTVTLTTKGTQAIRARDTATSTITGLQTGIVVQ